MQPKKSEAREAVPPAPNLGTRKVRPTRFYPHPQTKASPTRGHLSVRGRRSLSLSVWANGATVYDLAKLGAGPHWGVGHEPGKHPKSRF